MLVLRRIRFAMVAVAVVVVTWLVWQARGALVPFVVGGILAFLLAPLVERLARVFPFHRTHREIARTFSIVIVYLLGTGVLISAGALLVPALVNQAVEFANNIPRYAEVAQDRAQEWTIRYRERVPFEMQDRIDGYVARLGEQAGAFAGRILSRSVGLTGGLFSVVLGYAVIPFWLFYVLKDRHKLGPSIQKMFPESLRPEVDACIRIVQRVLGSYIRAQLTLALFIGVVTTIGLFLLGVNYFVVLGIIAGLTELIPVLGPIIGAVPALIVVIATEPEKTVWVLLFYVLVQQLENAVLVPRIQGQAVDMHPALILVLLVIAQQVAGFFGMVLVVPLAAVSRDLYRYVYRRLREQEAAESARARVSLVEPSGRLLDTNSKPSEDV